MSETHLSIDWDILMERKQILQVIVPVLAASLLIIGVGALILLGEPNAGKDPKETEIEKAKQAQANQPGAGSGTIPFPLDSEEWKDGPQSLKIWDVVEGTGEECPPRATVTVHYTGWLTSGTSFDSSYKRGEPATFSLNEVIPGWTQGIPGMKVGGKRRLYIPWPMAYGAQGRPGSIPPKADLIFEVELISVN